MFSYDPLSDAKWTIENRVLATLTPRPPVEKEIELSRAMVRGMRGGTTYVTVSARGFSARHAIRVRESGGVPWLPEAAPGVGR